MGVVRNFQMQKMDGAGNHGPAQAAPSFSTKPELQSISVSLHFTSSFVKCHTSLPHSLSVTAADILEG
jgi:hypothetical protein